MREIHQEIIEIIWSYRFMCLWIDTTADKLLLNMGVPVVFDSIISPSWKLGSNLRPPKY